MNNYSLQHMLSQNVVELNFKRRHRKPGWSDIRGLFGTTNYEFLNGDFGMYVFNFKPPNGQGMGYDYKSKNLCVVWDIFRQEFRVFGAEQVSINRKWPLSSEEDKQIFMEYFDNYIKTMSNDDKLKFMGYHGHYVTLEHPSTSAVTKKSIWKSIGDKFLSLADKVKLFFSKFSAK